MDEQFNEQENTSVVNFPDELELFKTAVQKAPLAVSIADEKNNHVFLNRSFTELFGYDLAGLKEKSLKLLFADPHMYEIAMAAFFSAQSWSAELEMIHRDGSVIPVQLSTKIITDAQGGVVGNIGYYTDLLEKEKTEHELDCQKEYLSTLHSVSLGMFRRIELSELLNVILTKISKLTSVPNSYIYLYDLRTNDLELKAGCGLMAGFTGDRVLPGQGMVGEIFEKGEPFIVDNFQRAEKSPGKLFFDRFPSVMGIPLISGSRISGVIGICHDDPGMQMKPEFISVLEEFAAIASIVIDSANLFETQKEEIEKRLGLEKEKKENQIRLYQSQRMDAIGTLAAGIAHDFNNILSSIIGFTQMAQSEAKKGSDLQGDLNEIYNASLRARDLVQQILAFARQSNDKTNPIKVSLVVKEVLKLLRSSIPTTITIEHNIIAKEKVLANPTQIYQVFLNLFTNSAQAMEETGGILTVALTDEILENALGDAAPGPYVKACVSDTGTGIDEELLHSIFEPYFTTRKTGEGTGLGLSVVHGVVKSMGGEILVESTKGKGTTFSLYFPVARLPEPVENIQPGSNGNTAVPGKGEHVLFVDDEPQIAEIGKRLLERLNYKVTALTSSREALEAFARAPEDFQVVLTDMTMPEMTGEKLAGELKKIRPDIPVILCTGHQKYESKEDLAANHLDYVCRKPITRDELATAIRKMIDGPL